MAVDPRETTTIRRVSWQAAGAGPGGSGAGADADADAGADLFAAVETNVRDLVAAPWWAAAAPQQRAEQIAARMLWGAA